MANDELIEIEYDILPHETDKAWLFVINGEEVWLPFSKCEIDTKAETVSVPEWLAMEKGLV